LLVGSLAFNVIIVLMQVIMRSVFNYSLSWTEELSRYIFIWQVWLGASTALKYNEHIRVELIFTFVKNVKVQRIIKAIANLIWLAFCIFLTSSGWKLVQSMIGRNALSSGMRVPLAFVYIVLPISALLICIRLVPRIISDIRSINSPASEKEAAEGGNA
ncbi:MAG TPA: TRAP transporter small permease, partial [Clostridia bacterium]|nr:TRAP transporter small permease [Clostridia bacterium]